MRAVVHKVVGTPTTARTLTVGKIYLSPSGRLCRLRPSAGNRLSTFYFVYLSRDGSREIEETFSIDVNSSYAISKFQEVVILSYGNDLPTKGATP